MKEPVKNTSASSQRNWKKYYAKRKNKLFKVCRRIRRQITSAGLFKIFPFQGSDYSIGQRIACLLFKHESKKSYLETEDFLKTHPRERNSLGIGIVPDSNTIWRANYLFKEKLRKQLFNTFFANKKKSKLAMDSSGFSQNRFAHWLLDKKKKAKDFIKAHVLSQVTKKKLIVAFSFSNGKRNDCKRGVCLIRKGKSRVFFDKVFGDRGYPSRKLAQAIADEGGEPWLRPKSNTGTKSKGSPAFRKMVISFRKDEEAWMKEYGVRSVIEGLFSWLKRKFGGALTSTRYACQKAELTCKLFLYNVYAQLFF